VELGAEFLHGSPEPVRADLRAAAILLERVPDVHAWSAKGRWSAVPDFRDEVQSVTSRGGRSKADRPFEEVLRKVRGRRRQMARLFVEGYHAADTNRISALALAGGDEESEEGEDDSAAQHRLPGGYDRLLAAIALGADPKRLRIRLGSVATSLRWSRGRVRVDSRSRLGDPLPVVLARAAVVTLPIGVLRAPEDAEGAVRFQPEVPPLARALSGLEMGPVVKLVLRFREAPWNERGFVRSRFGNKPGAPAAVDFVHDPESPFPTAWTWGTAEAAVLTGWAGGPRALRLSRLGERALVTEALSALATSFGLDRSPLAAGLEGWASHDWQADPFSRGAYSYVLVGGTRAAGSLARPVADTLFFAGEALVPDQQGTVTGAIASGRAAGRAAARVFGRSR
jgi:monoamine oxidase